MISGEPEFSGSNIALVGTVAIGLLAVVSGCGTTRNASTGGEYVEAPHAASVLPSFLALAGAHSEWVVLRTAGQWSSVVARDRAGRRIGAVPDRFKGLGVGMSQPLLLTESYGGKLGLLTLPRLELLEQGHLPEDWTSINSLLLERKASAEWLVIPYFSNGGYIAVVRASPLGVVRRLQPSFRTIEGAVVDERGDRLLLLGNFRMAEVISLRTGQQEWEGEVPVREVFGRGMWFLGDWVWITSRTGEVIGAEVGKWEWTQPLCMGDGEPSDVAVSPDGGTFGLLYVRESLRGAFSIDVVIGAIRGTSARKLCTISFRADHVPSGLAIDNGGREVLVGGRTFHLQGVDHLSAQ